MADEIDLRDGEQLRAWLETRSSLDSCLIAVRCAMRAIPFMSAENALDDRLAARAWVTRAFGATLLAVSSVRFDLEESLRKKALHSDKKILETTSAEYLSASSASYVVDSIASATRSVAYSDEAYATSHAAFAAFSYGKVAVFRQFVGYERETISEISYLLADGHTKDLLNSRIWLAGVPDGSIEAWGEVKKHFSDDAALAFWLRWYEAMRDGNPPDWGMQREIALIDDAIWDEGPDAVAAEIAKIEARYLEAAAPLAETIEANPETGRLHVVPVQPKDPPLLSVLLGQVEEALELTLAQRANGLSELNYPVPLLRSTLTKHAADPQRIEMNLVTAAKSLRRQIDVTQDLPRSEENLALLDAVEDCGRGVRAAHPEVARVRSLLAEQALKEASPEDRQALADAAPMLDAISEGLMQEDFAADIPALVADRSVPGVTEETALPGLDETARVYVRVARSHRLLTESPDTLERLEATTGMRAGRIINTLTTLIMNGLRLFGIL